MPSSDNLKKADCVNYANDIDKGIVNIIPAAEIYNKFVNLVEEHRTSTSHVVVVCMWLQQ